MSKLLKLNKRLYFFIIFFCVVLVGAAYIFLQTVYLARAETTFRFISWGDAQDNGANLPSTSNQAASLNPNFTIFNGDLEQDGVRPEQMAIEIAAMNGGGSNNGMFNKTFPVRGNHDDHLIGSAGLWQSYISNLNRPLPAGVTNYMGIDSGSTYLTYSFDYGNARFIGIDVPGNAVKITSAQTTFLDNRLTDAENRGLIHAFIYFHGPLYCAANHCSCTSRTDSSCTPSALISVINNHPIVSATFHGHEHLLGWTHMDNSRVSSITHPFEQFITSPSGSGSNYTANYIPGRMDYINSAGGQAFAAIDVNGSSFTVNLYRVGTSTPVWSKIFTKSGAPPPSISPTRSPTPGGSTPTRTPTQPFVSPSQPFVSPTPISGVCTYFKN